MAQDVTLAVIALLSGDPEILEKVGLDSGGRPRVYGEEMPEDAPREQPRHAIVIRRVPGATGMGGFIEMERGVLEIASFGRTIQLADELRRRVHYVLKQAKRQVQEKVLLHSFELVSGAQSLRDAEADWPLVRESWQFLASENEISTS